MKKFGVTVVAALTVFTLAACNSSGEDDKSSQGKSQVASISIEDGEYIIPPKEDGQADEGEGFLALKVKITNDSDKSLDLASEDFMLYDSEDNKISLENFYLSESELKTLSYEKISAGKSKTGYLIFSVIKDEPYELFYEPVIYDIEEELDPIVLEIDSGSYDDNSAEAQDAAAAYIDEVFLAQTNEDYEKLVANDLEEAVQAFDAGFGKGIKNEFRYAKASDEETAALAEKYREINGEKAEITYEIASFYPDTAEISIRTTLLSFEEMEDAIDSIEDTYTETHKEQDYDERLKNAQKAALEKLPELFESTDPIKVEAYGDGTFSILLKKKDDKWTIQTDSSYAYGYNNLETAFRGGLYKD